jgi:hypothetical protein
MTRRRRHGQRTGILLKWPGGFVAGDLAAVVDVAAPDGDARTLPEFLWPGCLPMHVLGGIGRVQMGRTSIAVVKRWAGACIRAAKNYTVQSAMVW